MTRDNGTIEPISVFSRASGLRFPAGKDRHAFTSKEMARLSLYYPPSLARSTLDSLQSLCAEYKGVYMEVRRWIIVATEAEIRGRIPSLGVSLVVVREYLGRRYLGLTHLLSRLTYSPLTRPKLSSPTLTPLLDVSPPFRDTLRLMLYPYSTCNFPLSARNTQ